MNYKEALKECFTGFYNSDENSLLSVVMIFGSTMRADHVYMNMARCMNKPIQRNHRTVNKAVTYANYGLLMPVLFAFLLNMIMLSIASETAYGDDQDVGLANLCSFFVGKFSKIGCKVWGFVLLVIGQSSFLSSMPTGKN